MSAVIALMDKMLERNWYCPKAFFLSKWSHVFSPVNGGAYPSERRRMGTRRMDWLQFPPRNGVVFELPEAMECAPGSSATCARTLGGCSAGGRRYTRKP